MNARWPFAALGAAAIVFVATSAVADDNAAAQAIYDQATKAMDAKDFATACPKLEEVVKLVPTGVGAKMTLGSCYEGAGKLASAWSAYVDAQATATRLGQAPRAESAQRSAEALKPRLAVLTIDAPDAVKKLPGFGVQRDATGIALATLGVALPVDKGTHTITATATGKKPWTQSVDVTADGVKLTLAIGELADEAPTTDAGPKPPQPIAAGRVDDPPSSGRTSPLVYVGFITAGVGVGIGAVTGIMTMSQGSTCKTACTSSDLSSAKTTAKVSDVAFGVGLAGAAVGVVGIVISRKASAPRSALVIGPTGASLHGLF